MDYILNENVTDKQLKDYGFKYNGVDYINRVSVYYIETAGRKNDIIFVKFILNIKDKMFNYEVICSDNSIYYPFYTNDNSTVNDIINKNFMKQINKMTKEGIIMNNTTNLSTNDRTQVKIKKLNKHAKLPTYGSECAAGADLYALVHNDNNMVTIQPGATEFIGTGIAMEIPEGYVGLIYARSGLSCKYGLAPANKVGVIDSDYRGEIMVALHNHSDEAKVVTSTDRIAQIVIQPVQQFKFVDVESDELDGTERGEGGFGSSGK